MTQPPAPTMDEALVMAGAFCHFLTADRRIAELFAIYADPDTDCPHDYDVDLIIEYIKLCHGVLAPKCKDPL